MNDFKKLIYASDLIEWIMETYPDWCVGAVRSIIDHVEGMSSAEPDESTCWGCNCPKMDSLEQPTQTNADSMQWSALDCVRRQQAIDEIQYIGRLATLEDGDSVIRVSAVEYILQNLPSAQTEYKPVTAEDFAKTMSESTLYQYMAWYGWALALMKEQRFVICKKTM